MNVKIKLKICPDTVDRGSDMMTDNAQSVERIVSDLYIIQHVLFPENNQFLSEKEFCFTKYLSGWLVIGYNYYMEYKLCTGTKLYTVDSRYLDLAYLEYALISKRKSGPCLNMKI